MVENEVQKRLENLEQKVGEILAHITLPPTSKSNGQDWQRSLGMFDDRPLMREIDNEGCDVRTRDRQESSDDPA